MARIFKIGLTEIAESDSTAHLTNEEVQTRLATTYPEVKNATLKETPRGEDTVIEWIPAPGRKG